MANGDNSNGPKTSLPYQAIIVLCLVGAGAAVLVAYALFRNFYEADAPPVDREHSLGEDGLTQAQYMRVVRLRNQEDLQRCYGHLNHNPRPKPTAMSSVSSSHY